MSSHLARIAAPLLLLALGAPAAAHNVGTPFSSPVDADGAALYWNPAAMALAQRSLVQIVATAAVGQASYQRDGIDSAQTGRPFPRSSFVVAAPQPVLGIIIDRLWRSRLRLGFTASVPSATGAAWPETIDDRGKQVLSPTRYHVNGAEIFHAHVQAGASIVLHRMLAIGVALNVVASSFNVRKHLDLANQSAITNVITCGSNPLGCENPAVSTPLHFRASGVSAGASVGLLFWPIPRLRFGVSYISAVRVPLAVSLQVDSGKLDAFVRQFAPAFGTLSLNGAGRASVTVPQRFHFAVAADVHPRVEVMAMFRWINYAATNVVSGVVTQRNSFLLPDALSIPIVRDDEWYVAARITGRIKERTKVALTLDYLSKTTPEAFSTPSNLDFDSISLNLGVNVRVWRTLYLGAMFAQAFVFPRTISRTSVTNTSPDPYNLPDSRGRYTGNSEQIGLDVTGRF